MNGAEAGKLVDKVALIVEVLALPDHAGHARLHVGHAGSGLVQIIATHEAGRTGAGWTARIELFKLAGRETAEVRKTAAFAGGRRLAGQAAVSQQSEYQASSH